MQNEQERRSALLLRVSCACVWGIFLICTVLIAVSWVARTFFDVWSLDRFLPSWTYMAIIIAWLGLAFFGCVATLALFIHALQSPEKKHLRPAVWHGLALFAMVGIPLMLLPVSKATPTAENMQNSNHIKQLNLALLNYASAHDGQLPPHRVGTEPDENGIYPHSWRVYLLPYMEQNWLYKQIRLDEPWDSEWNRQFHEQMPL